MITKFKIFENWTNKYNFKYNFVIGDNVWSTAFKKFYKVVDIDDSCLWIEDEFGNITNFLKKDFIPEIEYNASQYNI